MLLTNLAIILITLYVAGIAFWKHTFPRSISETFYIGGGYSFTLVMFAAALMIIAGLLGYTEDTPFQFVSFFAGSGLALVGAAPCFKDEHERKVHFTGATLILLGSQIWLLLYSCPWVLLIWLTTPLWIRDKYKLLICEIFCVYSFPLALLLERWTGTTPFFG